MRSASPLRLEDRLRFRGVMGRLLEQLDRRCDERVAEASAASARPSVTDVVHEESSSRSVREFALNGVFVSEEGRRDCVTSVSNDNELEVRI